MMIRFMFICLCVPCILNAQGSGIEFAHNLNWEQVLSEAKNEKKYIFVDCFATWCVPCKRMEKEIYTNDTVGKVANENFISLKLQMDTSDRDNEGIRSWYADAHKIQEKYKINAYPTFLFFSPDGQIVHRGAGFLAVPNFLELLSEAEDPRKQLYSVLKKYDAGEKEVATMRYIMDKAKMGADAELYNKIVTDYTKYVLNQGKGEILTKDNLSLLRHVTETSHDKGFELFYKQTGAVDKIMWHGYAEESVQRIICQEEVEPRLHGALPDWNKLRKAITQKYNAEYARVAVERGVVWWYARKMDLKNYTKYLVKYLDAMIPMDDSLNRWYYINGNAWSVFLYSSNKDELKTAARWVKQIINNPNDPDQLNPNIMDTYANLVYKIGNRKDALIWEEKAAKINTSDPSIQKAFEKMQKGEKTWPDSK